jgi:hypothetical protein
MSGLRDIDIEHIGIGKMLADGNLVIPPFQRSYA